MESLCSSGVGLVLSSLCLYIRSNFVLMQVVCLCMCVHACVCVCVCVHVCVCCEMNPSTMQLLVLTEITALNCSVLHCSLNCNILQ